MNITIAIDSLKGSLSSLEAGHAIEEGIRRVYKDAAVNVRPLADGGEGTVEALACGMGGTLETVTVTGPWEGLWTASMASFRKAARLSLKCLEPPGSPWFRMQKRIP